MSSGERGMMAVGTGLIETETVIDKEAELRKTVVAQLLRLGVVTIDEKRFAGGIIVNDLDFFRGKSKVKDPDTGKDFTSFELMNEVPQPMKNGLGDRDSQKNYYHVFHNQRVITREDLKNGLRPREMFFTLEDKEDLRDADRLRGYRGKFYLLLPEVGGEFDVRKNFQPTRKDGFDSGVDSFEANVLAMIYISGEGGRDANGELWVNRTAPGVGQQRLSGSWLARMGFKSFGGLKWKDQPRELLARNGADISAQMLNAEDFSERTREKMVVGKNGQLVVDGTRVFFGRDKAGYRVRLLSGSEHLYALVNDDNVVDGVFNAGQRDDIVLRPMVIAGRIVGMIGGSYRERKIPSKSVIKRYGADGAIFRLRVDSATAATELIKLGERIAQIDPEAVTKLDGLGYEQQIQLLNSYLSMNEDSRREMERLIANRSRSYVKAMAYLSKYGGISSGKDLIPLPRGLEGERLMATYCDAIRLLDSFKLGIKDRLDNRGDALSQSMNEFLVRVIEGVAYRVGTYLGRTQEIDSGIIEDEISRLNCCLLAIEESLSGEGHVSRQIQTDGRGKVTHATVACDFGKNDDSDQLYITFRPQRISEGELKSGRGQPRVGFTFKRGKESFSLRIDLEAMGLSVDVGSHEGELAKKLRNIGATNNTYGIVDDNYQLAFPEYVRRMAGLWGVPESTWTQSHDAQ